jgi:hypothetical protein
VPASPSRSACAPSAHDGQSLFQTEHDDLGCYIRRRPDRRRHAHRRCDPLTVSGIVGNVAAGDHSSEIAWPKLRSVSGIERVEIAYGCGWRLPRGSGVCLLLTSTPRKRRTYIQCLFDGGNESLFDLVYELV